MPKTPTKKKKRTSSKPSTIQVEATQVCMRLIGELIRLERMLRNSETTSRNYLTWSELARMANHHLDADAPDISAQTVKAVETDPSTYRAWRSIVPILRALGYHAEFKRT